MVLVLAGRGPGVERLQVRRPGKRGWEPGEDGGVSVSAVVERQLQQHSGTWPNTLWLKVMRERMGSVMFK